MANDTTLCCHCGLVSVATNTVVAQVHVGQRDRIHTDVESGDGSNLMEGGGYLDIKWNPFYGCKV